MILDPIRINLKVKELLNYKIDKIVVSENLSTSWGGPGLTMLITEHALLCQIRIQDEEPGFYDMINEQELPLVIGLA